ncbi:MAG: hypothetical protein M9904_13375 [Chitinophagaceae bacterium]|nr:hypothetical protein [Chitinophagaceae bacterium]
MRKPYSFYFSFYLLLPVITMTLYACKKDGGTERGNGSGFYMKFKLNDVQFEYKGTVEGTFSKPTSTQYGTSAAGLKEAFVANKNNMTLLLATTGEVQKGTSYTSYTSSSSGMQKAKLAQLVFIDENGKNYFSWMEEMAPALPSGTETNAVIKITEAGSGYFKGNFSGVLYSEDYTVKLVVKDGEFYARSPG